jgi:hypothetical protein
VQPFSILAPSLNAWLIIGKEISMRENDIHEQNSEVADDQQGSIAEESAVKDCDGDVKVFLPRRALMQLLDGDSDSPSIVLK